MPMLKRILDRRGIHYGWAVCAACALVLFCTSGLAVNAFSVYQPFLIAESGMSNAESSMVLMARSFMSFLSVFFIGPFYRRFSLRFGLALACASTAAGFLLFGVGRGFLSYCIAGLVIGIGFGVGTMVPAAMLIARWFCSKRAFALGVCAAATGLSTIGVPSLITCSIAAVGLMPTFVCEAAVVVACAGVCALVVRDAPERMGCAPYGSDRKAASQKGGARPPREMSRSSWAIAAPALMLLGAVSTVGLSHLGVLAASVGYGAQEAACAITVAGAALLVGKVVFGEVGDRCSVERATVLFGSAAAAGLVLLCQSANGLMLLLAGMALYGAGVSLSSVGMMSWAADLSSEQRRDETMRRFQLFYAAGGFLASPFPGMVADACGGSYVAAYAAFAVFSVLIVLAVAWLYSRNRMGRARHVVPGFAKRAANPGR